MWAVEEVIHSYNMALIIVTLLRNSHAVTDNNDLLN